VYIKLSIVQKYIAKVLMQIEHLIQ